MSRPPGAFETMEDYLKADQVYAVYGVNHPSRAIGHITNRFKPWQFTALGRQNWFDGEIGYIFDNYFHALAYSLKVKKNGPLET